MREIDLIFNFSEVFTKIKDIILDEILKYYNLEEQKNITYRMNDTLFVFYDDSKLKVDILRTKINEYEQNLIMEMAQKLNLKDKNIKNLFSHLNNKMFSNIIENIYNEDEMIYYKDIYTRIFKELDFDLDYNGNLVEQVRNNKTYYEIITKINNEMLIHKAKLDSFENYIKIKYKKIYDSYYIQEKNELKLKKRYSKLFLEYLDNNNLLNKNDKEKLKSNEPYLLFECYNIYFNENFEHGKIDYILDKNNNLDTSNPNYKKVINYLNECGMKKENYESILSKIKEYRELTKNHYLINTIGQEKEVKKVFEWFEKYMFETGATNGKKYKLQIPDKLFFIKEIIRPNQNNKPCHYYRCTTKLNKKKIMRFLQFSPALLYNNNLNYFQVLIHEMIHGVDGDIKNTGYLNEFLVEKFSLIIYEKIKTKLQKKYPFIDFNKDYTKNAYQDTFPIFDSIIDNNLFKFIECKGTENQENTLYEYFGKENIDSLIKIINESFDRKKSNNSNINDLMNDLKLMQKINNLKTNIDNHIALEKSNINKTKR